MTAPAPAPKASGTTALPATSSSVPPSSGPPVNEDFLAVIMQALTGHSGAEDNPPTPQPAKEKPSPSAEEAALDPTAASQLLALLVPPLPILLKSMARKVSAPATPPAPVDPSPASAPAQSVSETKPQRPEASAVTFPVQPGPPKEAENKSTPPSGTPVANTSSTMNSRSERNEIAGRTEQKLPLAAVSAVSSGDTGGSSPDAGSKMPLPFSWHETPSESVAIIELSTAAATHPVPSAAPTVEAPTRVIGTMHLQRLEQMVSREVLTVRQTGAERLGVTLKLDANTQLFLQLTTNDGQVQASVRCERGQFAPEEAQWAQLQQSLARQNVELLPMTGGSNLNFQQPSGKHPRQPAPREDWSEAGAAPTPAQSRKQKEQNRPRKNWESWA